MIVRRSESTVIPTEIDDTSSQVTVYINRNIVPVDKKNDDGTTTTFYQFDQEVYTKEEYIKMVTSQTRADLDYLAETIKIENSERDTYLLDNDFRLSLLELGVNINDL